MTQAPDGGLEVSKLRASSPAGAERLARELASRDGVVAQVNRTRSIEDPATGTVGRSKGGAALPVGGTSPRLTAVGALSAEARGASQWGLRAVGAEVAWDVTRGSGTVVAVVDTGVDFDHPDLTGQLLPQIDVIDDGWTGDLVGHGTHVAGIVAASLDGAGVAGLANQVKVLPVRVCDEYGDLDSYAIAAGIGAAVDAGADVINLSFGGGYDAMEEAAIDYALDNGVVVVAAAGNEYLAGNPTTYPAALPGVIGVSSADEYGRSSDFANVGSYVDITAPGQNILSTVPGGGWETGTGTSMAAPFVAATAGLVHAANPSLGRAQVEAVLLGTAVDDASGDGPDTVFGYGLLRADSATARAATLPGGIRYAAPTARVKVTSVSSRSKLRVDVDPNKGRGYWTFRVQKKRADGTWKPLKTYRTRGSAETRTINLPKGTYRVVVRAKYGYAGTTSGSVVLKR